MTTTVKGNLIIPEILIDAVAGELAGVIALFGTDAATVNSSLPQPTRGGDTVTVPYFGTLGELDDVASDGDSLTPAGLTMTDEDAVVQHSGKAFELTQWAQMAAMFADPYAEAARQIKIGVIRRLDAALITAANGTTLIKDVYNAVNPVTLDWDTIVDAMTLWKDEQRDVALLTVHSKVLGDLRKLRDADGRPLLTDMIKGGLPTFNGVPVLVSDRNVATSDTPKKYKSLLIKKGALLAWYTGNPSVQTFHDVLKDSDLAAIHVYFVAYLYKRLPGSTLPGAIQIVTN